MSPDSQVRRAAMAYFAPLLGLLAVVAVSRAQVQVCANAAGESIADCDVIPSLQDPESPVQLYDV